MVKILLVAGADVNAKSKDGWTALHIGSKSGPVAIVELLLESGADPSIKASDGKTAYDVALDARPPNTEMLELLTRMKGGAATLHSAANRPPRPTAGALVDSEMPAQPAEVATLLRELSDGGAQAANVGGR
jgi:ankyrin repeat protein